MGKKENKYINWMKNHKIITAILAIVLFSMFMNLVTPDVEYSANQGQYNDNLEEEKVIKEDTETVTENNSKETSQEEKSVVYNSDWDGSVAQVKNYLRNNLNDWDSYESIEWSEVQEVNISTHKYIVRYKYRANNAYGGTILKNQLFYLDEEGNVVNVRDWN